MEREKYHYSATPESRAEDLRNWSNEELQTLHATTQGRVEQGLEVMAEVEDILTMRSEVQASPEVVEG